MNVIQYIIIVVPQGSSKTKWKFSYNHSCSWCYIGPCRSTLHIIGIASLYTGGTNDVLAVYINTTNPRGAFVKCTFHPVYNCSIDYGTDPSYTSLVHRDTSSTQGRTATITLSLVLRDDTTYYYIVSAESNSHCVRVQGKFKTGISTSMSKYILNCVYKELMSTEKRRKGASNCHTFVVPSSVKFSASKTRLIR